MEIKKGSKVKINYTGKLADGTIFDSSKGKAPLEFEVGSKQVIKGFDDGVIGMKKGEKKTIEIPCKDAYGERDEELKKDFPKDQIPENIKIKIGMTLPFSVNGQFRLCTIVGEDDKNWNVDLNHPLSGKDLVFEVEIVDVD